MAVHFSYMTQLCICDSWGIFWYVAIFLIHFGVFLPVLDTLMLVRCARLLVSQCPIDFLIVVAFFCCFVGQII